MCAARHSGSPHPRATAPTPCRPERPVWPTVSHLIRRKGSSTVASLRCGLIKILIEEGQASEHPCHHHSDLVAATVRPGTSAGRCTRARLTAAAHRSADAGPTPHSPFIDRPHTEELIAGSSTRHVRHPTLSTLAAITGERDGANLRTTPGRAKLTSDWVDNLSRSRDYQDRTVPVRPAHGAALHARGRPACGHRCGTLGPPGWRTVRPAR